MSEMSKLKPSLDTIRRVHELLPSFYRKQAPRVPGGHLAWCMAGVSPEIPCAFDLPVEWPEAFGSFCASNGASVHFMEQAESEGYSPDLCAYVRNSIGYSSRTREVGGIPPEAPKGGMGTPTMLLGTGVMCDPRIKWFQTLSTQYLDNIPVFHSDPLSPPHDADTSDPRVAEQYLDLLRQTLHEQIDFIAKQLGRPIDLEKLRNTLALAQQQSELTWEIHELRAAVPCPMSAEDFFYACVAPMMFMAGEPEVVNFLSILRDEVRERVARGIGVIANERYRLLFMGIPPWYNLGFFNRLHELGVVFPVESGYFQGQPVEIDLSDPVEALVQRSWKRSELVRANGAEINPDNLMPSNLSYAGTRMMTSWVEKFKLDGIIQHRTRSCRAASWGQAHMKDLFAKKGIPTLTIESDMGDPRSWNQSAIMGQVQGLLGAIDAGRKVGAPA